MCLTPNTFSKQEKKFARQVKHQFRSWSEETFKTPLISESSLSKCISEIGTKGVPHLARMLRAN